MLQIIIFVCSLSVSPGDCNNDTANSVTVGGKVAMPTQCVMLGQSINAGAGGVSADDKFYVKVECRREHA